MVHERTHAGTFGKRDRFIDRSLNARTQVAQMRGIDPAKLLYHGDEHFKFGWRRAPPVHVAQPRRYSKRSCLERLAQRFPEHVQFVFSEVPKLIAGERPADRRMPHERSEIHAERPLIDHGQKFRHAYAN